MTTAQKILKLLKGLWLDQKGTAKAIGVAYPTFRSYLRDVSPSVPGVDIAIRMARTLKVSVDWLYDDDQDWPPPESHTPANIGPQELVAELARRRELLRKDMRNIASKLTSDRLTHLERLSGREQISEDQEAELDRALRGLFVYSILETQLEWLDPDTVHPTAEVDKLHKLLEGYFYLSGAFNRMRDERKAAALTGPLAARRDVKRSEVPRYDRDGGTFPIQPHPPRSRSRSTPKRGSTGKKSPPAKPQRSKRKPRS